MFALSAIFWGIVTFSILVVLHEGGHFVAARLFGVKVHEFMIGLPGPAIRFHAKKTTYGVTAVPLGGYVRIAGMEPGPEDPLLGRALKAAAIAGTITDTRLAAELGIDEDRADALLMTLNDWAGVQYDKQEKSFTSLVEADSETDPRELLDSVRKTTYRGLKTWQRITVLVMGVAVNLVAAILTFTVVLSGWGYQEPTTVINTVSKGSAAAKAGLKPGDEVVKADGKPVKQWEQLLAAIGKHKPGEKMVLEVKPRPTQGGLAADDGTVRRTAVLGQAPGTDGKQSGKAFLGVSSKTKLVRPDIISAFGQSLTFTGMVFVAIADFFKPSTFQTSISNARSVVGISVEVANAVKAGPIDYAYLIALLSLSLGALNILPIPPLDGGKVFMEIIERVLGRPLKREVYLGVSATGALLLFALIGYLMYADFVRYVVNG